MELIKQSEIEVFYLDLDFKDQIAFCLPGFWHLSGKSMLTVFQNLMWSINKNDPQSIKCTYFHMLFKSLSALLSIYTKKMQMTLLENIIYLFYMLLFKYTLSFNIRILPSKVLASQRSCVRGWFSHLMS